MKTHTGIPSCCPHILVLNAPIVDDAGASERAKARWDFLRTAVFDGRVRALLLSADYSVVTATFARVGTPLQSEDVAFASFTAILARMMAFAKMTATFLRVYCKVDSYLYEDELQS
eukprot:1159834-Pelagomonas_calceolata.AAC.5